MKLPGEHSVHVKFFFSTFHDKLLPEAEQERNFEVGMSNGNQYLSCEKSKASWQHPCSHQTEVNTMQQTCTE